MEEELEEEQNNSELLKDHYRKLVLQVGAAGIPLWTRSTTPLPQPSEALGVICYEGL